MKDNRKLAKWIRDKIIRGYPNEPLVNHNKPWCRVPTQNELSSWISQYQLRRFLKEDE